MTQQHPTPSLQRKQGEDATYQLASIIESSGDAILSKTLEGVITLWNRSAEELYGYARDEILGQSVSRLIPPDHQQELPAILERIKAGEAIRRFETVRVKKDGTLIDVSVRISPIRDAQGSIVGVSAIAHDIAEEKRIAEELARGSRELERMNSELQHQRNQLLLLNAALAEAQRGRQFFSTMSHELRTPLASIIGFSQLLLEGAATGDLSRQQQNNLERILKNGQHLLNLINDVLDLEKIEAGRMEVTYNQVDVRELLNWVVEETQSVIAWFFFCWISCCLIEAVTCFSGVDWRGLTALSGSTGALADTFSEDPLPFSGGDANFQLCQQMHGSSWLPRKMR